MVDNIVVAGGEPRRGLSSRHGLLPRRGLMPRDDHLFHKVTFLKNHKRVLHTATATIGQEEQSEICKHIPARHIRPMFKNNQTRRNEFCIFPCRFPNCFVCAMVHLARAFLFSSAAAATAAVSSIALAWNTAPKLAAAAAAVDKEEVLKTVAKDTVFQCMRNPSWDTCIKWDFGGLKAFWTAYPELVVRSKAILRKYLAAIYVRYPYGYYDGGKYISSTHISSTPGGRELFFCTKELLFTKQQGLLEEDAIKYEMSHSAHPDKLVYWLSDKDLRQQLETIFPGFVYPEIVYKAIEDHHARYIPIDLLAKDPSPERRIRNVVKHIQDEHEWHEKFYTDYLHAHPNVLRAYRQSAVTHLAQHPDTTNLPFFVRWYLKNKNYQVVQNKKVK